MNQKGQSLPETFLEGVMALVIAYVGLKIFEVLFPGLAGTALGWGLIILVFIMIYNKLRS